MSAASLELATRRGALLEARGWRVSTAESCTGGLVAGALERSSADVAVAVTGIAGPSGGSPQKPVGLVCFAWGRREGAVRALTRRFSGDREAVREAAVVAALDGLMEIAAAK